MAIVSSGAAGAPKAGQLERLVQELQARETTDRAAEQLLKLAQSDGSARKFLVTRLPKLIGMDWGPEARVWRNIVGLAGGLRIVEAIPTLAKRIDFVDRPTSFGLAAALEDKPAAKALAQIGDPAVPALVELLKRGELMERWEASYVLEKIGSPTAQRAIRDHVKREVDPRLRSRIEEDLASK